VATRPPRTFGSLVRLARTVDDRSSITHRHSQRVAEISALMAERLGLDDTSVRALHAAALVHDVGKVVIPDAVLLKPGPLDVAEIAIVQRHAAAGAELARRALDAEQLTWIRSHHERIDGCGYPDGLEDGEIPLQARLLAVADAYDAMVAHRVYRAGMAPDGVLEVLAAGAGTQWCPMAVDLITDLHSRALLPGTRRAPLRGRRRRAAPAPARSADLSDQVEREGSTSMPYRRASTSPRP